MKEYDKIMEIRESIGAALRKYMFGRNIFRLINSFYPNVQQICKFLARRNEEITCDEILLMLVHFRKSNMILQNEMISFYNNMIETNMNAFKDYQFFFKVFISNTNIQLIHNSIKN